MPFQALKVKPSCELSVATAATTKSAAIMSRKVPKRSREKRRKSKEKAEGSTGQNEPTVAKKGRWAALPVTWKVILWAGSVLGMGVTLLTLVPRISVDYQSLTDPRDPLSANFVVVNEGVLPLYDIEYAIHVTKITDANSKTIPHPPEQSHVPDLFMMPGSHPVWKKLSAGDKATITPGRMPARDFQFAVPLREGELEVVVGYKTCLLFRQKRSYKFVARYMAGQQVWVRQPRTE